MLASFIGTTIEWYDFFIYGTAAALIFNELFFPTFSDVAGKLAAFAVFGAGFVVRPLGGIVFGHFGDRLGRKSMLVLSLFIMGAATFLIGLLPTYDSFGVLAPVLLVVLRLLQGFAVGGEWGGAVLMAVEHSPKERRGYHGSWPQSGAPAGLVLASAAFALVSLLPKEQFMTWGWRVPFLCSVALLLVGLVIRLRLAETPTSSGSSSRGARCGCRSSRPSGVIRRTCCWPSAPASRRSCSSTCSARTSSRTRPPS
ncbi:MFS transporter [Nonomuraea thailandensis]